MNPSYIKVRLALLPSPKAYARRASAYLATEKLDECLADYDKILELDADNTQYKQKRKQLAKQIDERNEKLKAEMIGKLKEVGNKVLGKFGMSLDNFKNGAGTPRRGWLFDQVREVDCLSQTRHKANHSLGRMGIAGTSSDSSRMILLPLRMFVVRTPSRSCSSPTPHRAATRPPAASAAARRRSP